MGLPNLEPLVEVDMAPVGAKYCRIVLPLQLVSTDAPHSKVSCDAGISFGWLAGTRNS